MKLLDFIKNISFGTYFLIFVTLIYIILLIVRIDLFLDAIKFFYNILLQILPLFVFIFVLMGLSNYFITPKFIMKHLKSKGMKKWFYVVVGGILSSGPIYMWYPLLADLKNKGLSYGLIACFLYNRAIKIPLIPIAIFYFSVEYILVLTAVMIIVSIIQGILINSLMEG